MTEVSNRLGLLVEALYSATESRKITWADSIGDQKFQSRLGDHIITIERLWEEEAESMYTQIEIRNLDGKLIEVFWPSMIPGGNFSEKYELPWFKVMESIHTSARRQALGVEDAIDSLLSILSKP